MKVLVTGHESSGYNRDLIIIQGLVSLGIEVVEVPLPRREKGAVQKLLANSAGVDWIFMPSFSHRNVRLVKRTLPKLPLVFDPLVSRYLTKVYDFKTVWRFSPRAVKNYLKDYFSFRACDVLIADTEAHRQYYAKTFNIPLEKIHVVPVGAPTDMFFPMPKTASENFVVGFYGSFVPLQGASKIAAVAQLLQADASISFRLIGSGTDFDETVRMAKGLGNIQFLGQLPYETLNAHLAQFDVCLGIFGDTPKADLVIPNKIFHYAACQKAIITKRTPAIQEIFAHEQHLLLSSTKPEDIAEQIVRLKTNLELREKIAKNAFELVSSKYNSTEIAKLLLSSLIAQ